jgi:hypothetical protein
MAPKASIEEKIRGKVNEKIGFFVEKLRTDGKID